MKFKKWIKIHEGKDNPFGDLAEDISRDSCFPEEGEYWEIHEYLDFKTPWRIRYKVLRTFRQAWSQYAKQNGYRLPSEAEIEHKFCKRIESLGGLALKFNPAGWSGAPDRIILMPDGKIRFVEFKVLGAEPRPLQKFRLAQLYGMGFEAYVIDSMHDVDAFIKMIESEISESDICEKVNYDDIEDRFRL
jgi:uncharacterized protein YozE (UPF0346 family)